MEKCQNVQAGAGPDAGAAVFMGTSGSPPVQDGATCVHPLTHGRADFLCLPKQGLQRVHLDTTTTIGGVNGSPPVRNKHPAVGGP